MFNDLSSLTSYFKTRRSGRPRDMIAPGPDNEQWNNILETTLRTPDHGKLTPWYFIKIPSHKRHDFAHILEGAFRKANPDCRDSQVEAALSIAHMAPCLTIMVYAPKDSAKIPKQEQILSAGAAGMNLLHAAHANGYIASWITGWASYDDNVRQEFCNDPNEKIIGFFYIGSPSVPLTERVRPDSNQHIIEWA